VPPKILKKEKLIYVQKIRVNTMKGWNMTLKVKIIKDFVKGIDKIRSWLKKERRGFFKKRERM